MRWGLLIVGALLLELLRGASSPVAAQKLTMIEALAANDAAYWELSQRIWGWAEVGYQEEKSSAALATLLTDAGFTVKKGVAEIPTAFTATFGSGAPVIGILGEYDALPGVSQEAVPYRQQRPGVTAGHACGHHLFGVSSAAAAIAIAGQIKAGQLKGTVRFYGCPAEEGGSAKVFLVQAGLFNDCAAVLHWHPGSRNSAGDRSTMARSAVKFRFRGKAAHAAASPELGRSALDAVELTNHAAQLLREHTPDFTRIHHVVTSGGEAPNVVPEFAEVYYYVRHPKGGVVKSLYRRLELCAQAGALATETKLEVDYEGGTVEIMPNRVLSEVVLKNFRALCDLSYTSQEVEFAQRLSESLETKVSLDSIKTVFDDSNTIGKGSTDVGDVSWVVPTTGFSTACWVPGTPGHSWQAVACGGTGIARKGMNLATRVMAASAWDLFKSKETLDQARAELQSRTAGNKYETLMQPGQKPPLNYRKSPSERGAK